MQAGGKVILYPEQHFSNHKENKRKGEKKLKGGKARHQTSGYSTIKSSIAFQTNFRIAAKKI